MVYVMQMLGSIHKEGSFGFIVFTAKGVEALEFAEEKPPQQNSTNNAAK